ncbi:MAG: ribulokinase, partial [Rhodospirillales bacterium]|nr:ribulokinase [Acetobacter sp.]
MPKYAIGIDYGTNSVRAVIVDTSTGQEVGTGVIDYPSGAAGVLLDARDHHLARQHPGDYLFGLERSICTALEQASQTPGFRVEDVVGVGVDCTGSSPLPVDEKNVPLGVHPRFKGRLAAQCWLWKDHTSHREAAEITAHSAKVRPQYIAKCGNTYSSEWFWSKIWRCLKDAPDVFEAAYSWVELTDFIPSVLCGVDDPRKIVRGVCCAGHKALYSDEWGGLPDKEFLAGLDPKLADLRDRLYDQAHDATVPAGKLCDEWARKLGLPAGIPVAIGEMDVHYG